MNASLISMKNEDLVELRYRINRELDRRTRAPIGQKVYYGTVRCGALKCMVIGHNQDGGFASGIQATK